jgi:hypothetical protein
MTRTASETTTKDAPPAVHKRRGRPKNSEAAQRAAENSHNFFQSCSRIDPQDWGSRASIYVYRSEPIIDRSHSGDFHYIDKYQEQITEDRILSDHGSGKYKLMLNFQKPGAQTSSTVDTAVITLMNVKFPPKIAPGDWVDDPKNNKWAWARETFPKSPSANGAGQVLETLKVFTDIQNGLKPEAPKEAPPAPNPVSQVRETIQALKELAPQPAAATENATLQSIVQLIISQSKQQADQATAQIAAQSAQNNTLLQALLAQRNQPASNATSFADAVSVISDKLVPLMDKLKPAADEAITNFTRRSKMSGWMEMIQPAIPAALDFFKPLGVALAQRLMTPVQNGAVSPQNNMGYNAQIPASAPGQSPGVPDNGQTPQVPGAVGGGFPPVLNMIAIPLLNFMRLDADPRELGRDFASFVHEGYSADPRFSQALALARAAGANSVLVAFKGSPYWLDKGVNHDQPSLAEMEPKFQVFIESFLRWQPQQQEEEDEEDIIDITGGQFQ